MASLFERLFARITPNYNSQQLPDSEHIVNKIKDDPTNDHGINGTSQFDTNALNEITSLGSDRATRYQAIDMMRQDTTIAAALEVYADDCSPYNEDGKVIWAEASSDNAADVDGDLVEKAVNAVNRLLRVLDLNKNTWTYIYSLCTYGDLYIKTFTVSDIQESLATDKYIQYKNTGLLVQNPDGPPEGRLENVKLAEYIEREPDPSCVFDLTKFGKTAGYIKSTTPDLGNMASTTLYQLSPQSDKLLILAPTAYIHISLDNSIDRYPLKIKLFVDEKEDQVDNSIADLDGVGSSTYAVKSGKSILEDVYKANRELDLLENALLFNRLTRSSLLRILEVEVGNQSTANARNMVRRVKQMIEQKLLIDANTGSTKSYVSPGPIDNVVYVPVRGERGRISATTLGGDVDVKSITDVDYFANKVYAGLKIPKQYLGVSTDENGMVSNGTSLTKVDIRYSRTVKRIQNAYISGITSLVNTFLVDKNLEDYIGLFQIKMVSPSSIEETERLETLGTKAALYRDILDLFDRANLPEEEAREAVEIVMKVLSESELAQIIEEYKEMPEMPEDEFGEGDDSGPVRSPGGGFSGFSSGGLGGTESDFESESESELDFGSSPDDLFGGSDEQGFNDYQNEPPASEE